MIILGIDPGTAATGFGVIKKDKNHLHLIDFGCINTSPLDSPSQRLQTIHSSLKKIIQKHKPQIAAVEKLFFNKNIKTALSVGQARGVVLLTLIQHKLPLYEFTPLEVKQAVTSYGRADKKQIQEMIKIILKMDCLPRPDDAADALAVAVCCANSILCPNS